MEWISFVDKEPEFQSDILVFDGTNIVNHNPIYISYDEFKDWDPKPKYWIYIDDLIKGINQPERSKREDSEYGAKCDFGLWKSEMRCSEHGGNVVREVQ